MTAANTLARIDAIDAELGTFPKGARLRGDDARRWGRLCSERHRLYAALPGGWHPSATTARVRAWVAGEKNSA